MLASGRRMHRDGEEREMRVLVTAATKHGATGEIAQAIGEVLAEHGLDTTVLAPEQVDTVNDYDAVVPGSAVYAGHWLKPARELDDCF
jgi:menaquinone-dependent protoporphyrinogen oxidase